MWPFKKKEKTRDCDWCGASFTGEGLEVDGLLLCSQHCLDQKNAPPAPPKRKKRGGERWIAPLSDVSWELDELRGPLRRFHEVLKPLRAGRWGVKNSFSSMGNSPVDAMWELLEELSLQVWAGLSSIRNTLRDHDGDVAAFDEMKRVALTEADVVFDSDERFTFAEIGLSHVSKVKSFVDDYGRERNLVKLSGHRNQMGPDQRVAILVDVDSALRAQQARDELVRVWEACKAVEGASAG